MEAELQSHNLFLNTILDRIGRVKFHYLEQKEGELKEVRQERYGVASQQTAYVAAFSLAKRFKELRPAAMTALKEQASGTKSPQAAKLLMKFLKLDPEAAKFQMEFLKLEPKGLNKLLENLNYDPKAAKLIIEHLKRDPEAAKEQVEILKRDPEAAKLLEELQLLDVGKPKQ